MKHPALSVIGLALLLAACSPAPAPGGGTNTGGASTGGTSTGGTSSGGTSTGGTAAAGTLVPGNRVVNGPGAGQAVFQMPTGATSTSGVSEVARADVAADGSFTVTLPDEASIPYLGSGYASGVQNISQNGTKVSCTTSLSSSDPAARGSSITSGLFLQGGVPKGNLSSVNLAGAGGTFNVYTWTYVDRDVTNTGTADCTSTVAGFQVAAHFDYNMALRQGWNVVRVQLASSGGAASGTVTAEPLHGLDWSFSASGQ